MAEALLVSHLVHQEVGGEIGLQPLLRRQEIADPPGSQLLSNFADQTDKGRVGKNKTEL